MSSESQFRDTIIGSFCILLANICYANNEAIVKVSGLTIAQLMIGRYTVQFIIAIIWWNTFRKPADIKNW